jgi:hydroxypyruvate isomerase
MSDRTPTTRRTVLAASAAGAALGLAAPLLRAYEQTSADRKGNIHQTVCQWCYSKMSVEELARHAAEIGLKGIDLVGPEHFATLKKYGLIGSMTPSHPIPKGLNRTENHEECLARIGAAINATADAGFPNVICFSGNREGMDDEQGLANCAAAIKQVIGLAEKRKVLLCMELLNSKLNHKDYMCDRTAWGARLVNAVGSVHFKLLYDIYHMQVQEGDVIATIRQYKSCIGHYHTAGVPGRNELDETQELHYPAIMRAILATGFKGYVGQEFVPTRDPMTSLSAAVGLCDV